MQVIVVARKELPVVSFGLAVQAGGYDEDRDTLGVSDFVAAMLRKGTKNGSKTRSADDISHAIDFVGGALDAQATNEGTTVSCSALSKDAPLCLDLLSDVLLHPSFPESEMGDVRDQMMAAVASRYDNPDELAGAHFDNQLFGEKHPNGWVLTADDVRKIDRAKLSKFWRTFYHPNHAILAVAGDVDAVRLRGQLEKAFHGWARANAPARPGWTIPPAGGTRILLVDRPDLTQATIVLGHAGIKHADPRWYAVTLMNYVLGGSDFSSRLMTEVRSKRGLTYGIGSSFGASLYEGAFRVSAATKNETVWDALLASVNEIRRMQTEGPTARRAGQGQGLLRRQLSVQPAGGGRDRGGAGGRRGARPRSRLRARSAAAAGGRRRGAGQGGGQGLPAPRRRCWSSSSARETPSSRSSRRAAFSTSGSTSRTRSTRASAPPRSRHQRN